VSGPSAGRGRIVVLVGPTAVGKTSRALQLAARFSAEIVSADSMQVYRGMDIGTAKPTAAERAAAVHHLIDIVSPDQAFDAKRFQRAADRAVAQIRERGRMPLVVGGTGLYVKALLHGLFHDPGGGGGGAWAPRVEAYRRLGEEPHAALLRVDPAAALAIHPNDRVRAQRALDVFLRTGASITAHRAGHRFREDRYEALVVGLRMERESLSRRIDLRVKAMVRRGLLEEVAGLLRQGFSADLPPMQSLGYRHMQTVLSGSASLEEARELLARDTRRYAKRQMTWFQHQESVTWFDASDPPEGMYERIQAFYQER